MKYTLTLIGCDDNNVIEVIINEDQVKMLEAIAKQFEENSEDICQPILSLKLSA